MRKHALLQQVENMIQEVSSSRSIEEQALHNTIKYANNRVECDHSRLKARLRAMRGLEDRPHRESGHAFIQNVRRGHYELGVDARQDRLRCAAAFDELASII